MLINGERALAYIEEVKDIKPIENADRLELILINGWQVVCGKGEFQIGDKGVFFEIDSLLPNEKPFSDMEFLVNKKFKIKTQKIRGAYSQGLFVPLSAFDKELPTEIGVDCTKLLGVTYYVAEDNTRKAKGANPNIKYNNMAARNPKLAKKAWFKWFMKRMWGRKLLFFFFGRKKDNPKDFPKWIKKTDEDRCENCVWVLDNKNPFVVTEKIDGTSTTVFLDLTGRKPDFGVCSRNVRQVDANQETFFDGIDNVYWEMVFKYNMREALEDIAKEHNVKRVVLQGETYGASLQANPYKLDERRFAAFNLIFDGNRLGSIEAKSILDKYDIPFVPIIDESYILPDDLETLKVTADGKSVINNRVKREGFVYRSQDGKLSFKNVSREYLLKLKD